MTVSVVIPTFNRRALLQVAVESVLAQNVATEIIVVDDGSTDGTLPWLDEHFGTRVRVLANRGRRGPAGARNTGMRAATNDFIALLDSDDSFLPGHLASALEVFAAHETVGMVFGRARYEKDGEQVDYMGPNFERKLAAASVEVENGESIVFGEDFLTHLLTYGCWFNLSTVVLRRSVIGEGMDESLRVSEDYEFWTRIARRWRVACLKQPQIRYMLHDSNVSFEADGAVSGHASHLLRALDVIGAYPDLSSEQRRLVRRQKASVLFSWAYRARESGAYLQSLRLHVESMRHANRGANVLACLKLPVFAAWRLIRPG